MAKTTIEDAPVGARPDAEEMRSVRATLEAIVEDRSLLALLPL